MSSGKAEGIAATWKPRLVKTPAPTILAITTNVAVRAPIRPNPWDAGSFMAESPTTAA